MSNAGVQTAKQLINRPWFIVHREPIIQAYGGGVLEKWGLLLILTPEHPDHSKPEFEQRMVLNFALGQVDPRLANDDLITFELNEERVAAAKSTDKDLAEYYLKLIPPKI